MANEDLEMKIYVDGPIHTAFMKLAEECMQQGVQIDSIKFNWRLDILDMCNKIEEKPKNLLRSIRIQSSKAGEKANGR